MTLCYLSYLETNNYLKCDQKYLFGDLVQSISKPIHQEQVFVFLEMLKIYFPSGDSLYAPTALQEVERHFTLPPANDRQSVQLLSRIFSLSSLDSIGLNLSKKEVKIKQIDFDIAQFCTFMERLKFTWRTTFQVILYRAFKSGRASIVNAQKLIQKLSFKKQHSSGLTGLILKSILCRNSLNKDPSSPHNFFK